MSISLIGADEKWSKRVVVPAIDPVVELRCRRIDLSGFGEQVRDLLLRGDYLVVEFCGQPQAAALCDRGHLGVKSDSGRVAGRPLLWMTLRPSCGSFESYQQVGQCGIALRVGQRPIG